MKPHKHEKFIKMMADGVRIEVREKNDLDWMQAYCGFNAPDLEFRISPNQPADEEGWIPWYGGEGPAISERIDVRFRNWPTQENTTAGQWRWEIRDRETDITHYRIVKQKVNQPADEEGWIPWFGGENPAVGKMVDYKGLTATGSNWPSENLTWKHWGSGRDINRYRIHKEKVKQKVKKWRWMFFYPAPIQPSSIYVSEPFTEDEAAKYFDGFTRQRVVPEWKMEVECDD